MHLYLCDYLNPKTVLVPSDPRLTVVESRWGQGRGITFKLETDDTIPFEPSHVEKQIREVRMWKLGITKQKTPKKRSSFYVDTLVWREIPSERDCRNVETILKSLTAPFFGNKHERKVNVIFDGMVSYPYRVEGEGGADWSGGEWISYRVPAHIATRFVEDELDILSGQGAEVIQARSDFAAFYSENYWAHLWRPPHSEECKGPREREWLAEFEEKRVVYPKMVADWWASQNKPLVPKEDMWY